MVINQYFRTWCDENYDVSKEDFYETNARYIAVREWVLSGIKHGAVILVAAFLSYAFSSGDTIWENIVSALEPNLLILPTHPQFLFCMRLLILRIWYLLMISFLSYIYQVYLKVNRI